MKNTFKALSMLVASGAAARAMASTARQTQVSIRYSRPYACTL
jgi:hypothetical protein